MGQLIPLHRINSLYCFYSALWSLEKKTDEDYFKNVLIQIG